MMNETLTWREAYKAVYGFLDSIWQSFSEDDQEELGELDAFLSGMLLLEDGDAVDGTLMELWHEAVARETGNGSHADLTEQESYAAMLRFLTLWGEPNSDGTLLGLCQELTHSGPDRDDWRQAVEKVRQGEFDPYFGLSGALPTQE